MTTLTREELAELAGVAAQTVTRWIGAGMPAKRLGTASNATYQIDSAAAIRWLTQRRASQMMAGNRQRHATMAGATPFSDSELADLNRQMADELASWRPALKRAAAAALQGFAPPERG